MAEGSLWVTLAWGYSLLGNSPTEADSLASSGHSEPRAMRHSSAWALSVPALLFLLRLLSSISMGIHRARILKAQEWF